MLIASFRNVIIASSSNKNDNIGSSNNTRYNDRSNLKISCNVNNNTRRFWRIS